MKTKILLGLVAILTVFGCKDNIDTFDPDPIDPVDPPIYEEFNASAFVEVMDSDGEPLEGAVINLGDISIPTNEYGVAFLDDVEMGSVTFLTVDKDGYFHGSRRFYPAESTTSYLRVMLLEEITLGNFEASQGGAVSTAGFSLDFPSGSIVDAGGNAYTGTVNVLTAPLFADDENLNDKMPGDLVGETLSGQLEALASFGMVAVELRSPLGEDLQVAEGSTVEMSLEVPSAMTGAAPATIPMWSFDETEGIWKEEGVASLQGGNYVADLPHFSWWNCDAPFPLVKFGASFVFENGAPATQLSVCLSTDELNFGRCAYTNDEGVVCGLIPKDETLTLEVKDPCGVVIYTQEIGPYSDSATIGPITLPETSIITTSISGSAVDCNDNAVTNGFVRVLSGSRQYWFSLDENGSFDGDFINCSESEVTVTVIDQENLKQSLPQTYPFAVTIDAGTISVCENIDELITMTVPDLDTTFIWLLPRASSSQGFTSIYVEPDSTGGSGFFFLRFNGDTEGTYEADAVDIVVIDINNGMVVAGTAYDMTVTVTYYGEPGDLIQGTFDGLVDINQGGPNEFTGAFSARRE